MKSLAIILLLAVASCSFHFYHYNGTFHIGGEKQSVNGVVIIEEMREMNMTIITGMLDDHNHHHHSFEFSSKILKHIKNSDGSFTLLTQYVEGRIGRHHIPELHGTANLTGDLNKVTYTGMGSDRNETHHFTLDGAGKISPCAFYEMNEAARRAAFLIGENSHEFHAVQIINYAVMGYPYIRHVHINYYHEFFGHEVSKVAPGVLIVGDDYQHIAIVDKEGDKFIHSIRDRQQVVATPLSQIQSYFPNGYILKEYKCAYTA